MTELPFGPPRTANTYINAHGLRVGVRTNEPSVLEGIERHFPAGWKPLPAGPVNRQYSLKVTPAPSVGRISNPSHLSGCARRYLLLRGAQKLVETGTLGEVLQSLEYDLEIYVAERAPHYVFVHAGVVAWHGRAIVIPGRSTSGKSTLVAALSWAGASYYSDEFALLDPSGRVHAYPRPLRLRPTAPSIPVPDEHQISGSVARAPLPVGLVVVTKFVAGATWQPRPLSTGQAILALMANSMSARRQPHVVLATLRHALAGASAIGGPRGEAGDTAAQVLAMVSTRS
jgi:hypothetical protein